MGAEVLPPDVALPAVELGVELGLARVLPDGSEEVEGLLVLRERGRDVHVGGGCGTGSRRGCGRHGERLARFEHLWDPEVIFTDVELLIGRR